jgi:hypothetical protein
MPNIQNITYDLYTARIQLALGPWHGGTDDLLQFLSMAIFMLNQAVASMQTLFDVADSCEAATKGDYWRNPYASALALSILLICIPSSISTSN